MPRRVKEHSEADADYKERFLQKRKKAADTETDDRHGIGSVDPLSCPQGANFIAAMKYHEALNEFLLFFYPHAKGYLYFRPKENLGLWPTDSCDPYPEIRFHPHRENKELMDEDGLKPGCEVLTLYYGPDGNVTDKGKKLHEASFVGSFRSKEEVKSELANLIGTKKVKEAASLFKTNANSLLVGQHKEKENLQKDAAMPSSGSESESSGGGDVRTSSSSVPKQSSQTSSTTGSSPGSKKDDDDASNSNEDDPNRASSENASHDTKKWIVRRPLKDDSLPFGRGTLEIWAGDLGEKFTVSSYMINSPKALYWTMMVNHVDAENHVALLSVPVTEKVCDVPEVDVYFAPNSKPLTKPVFCAPQKPLGFSKVVVVRKDRMIQRRTFKKKSSSMRTLLPRNDRNGMADQKEERATTLQHKQPRITCQGDTPLADPYQFLKEEVSVDGRLEYYKVDEEDVDDRHCRLLDRKSPWHFQKEDR